MDIRTVFRLLLPALFMALALGVPARADEAESTLIRQSPFDKRSYASLVLPNQLKVLLISDPRTEKAAAALDVFVGSGSDPEGRGGLAHFLEHMLFLGTGKYPEAGEYQTFISDHGGKHNAYTAFEHTNYFFDVDQAHLEAALDRFGQFFVDPLFTPEYVSREMMAVESEYRSKERNDGWRSLSALKQALNPEHPLSRFSVGSLETLADREGHGVRDDLLAFYKRHYSSNRMALVVLGREPLPVLESWVRRIFSAVPNTDSRPERIDVPLFAPGRLPAQLHVEPVKDIRRLSISFPVPPLNPHWRTKPVYYISNLLGHEGEGSLLSALKARGWAEGLSAGQRMDHRDGALFTVDVSLTPDGLASRDQVAGYVFRYLDLIRRDGVSAAIFDEQHRLNEMHFRFRSDPPPMRYVQSLAEALHDYPVAEVLRGPYALDEFDEELIASYLGRMRPDNALVTVTARGVEADQRTPWFGTAYALAPLGATTVDGWRDLQPDADLRIPEPNPFVPDRLAVKTDDGATEKPVRIRQMPGLELWHQQDASFGLPQANFFFSVRSPVANDSPRHAVLTKLYVEIVRDQLIEFSYPAQLAGLNYEVYKHIRGFSVRLSGYDDKQLLFLDRLTRALTDPEITDARFARVRDELERDLRNNRSDAPYRQTTSEVVDLMLEPSWSDARRLAEVNTVTASELRGFVPRMLSRVNLVALSHGNVLPDDALAMSDVLQKRLLSTAQPVDVPSGRVVKLEPGKHYARRMVIDHDDSAVTVYAQGPGRHFGARARVGLVAQMLSSPFFHELRTERQLGYIVHASSMPLLEIPGIAFVVQSPVARPARIEAEIDAFLGTFGDQVAGMDDAQFERQKRALITGILDREETLLSRSRRYWRELDREHYDFDSRDRLAAAVRGLTKADMVDFYPSFLGERGQRRLVVYSPGRQQTDVAEDTRAATLIDEPESFKRGRAFFPAHPAARSG